MQPVEELARRRDDAAKLKGWPEAAMYQRSDTLRSVLSSVKQ
jgi:hypothetical protein